MYKKELDKLLQSNSFPNYFLLFGGDEYQIELYATEILNKFSKDNVLSLYFDDYEFNLAKGHLEQASLFADSNILHIKTDKKIPAKELKVLIDLCKKDENNAFIFELHEADMKAIFDNQKAFDKNFVRFFPPNNPNEAVNILSLHVAKLGIKATQTALRNLYILQNESLYLCASELNKLAQITDNINESVIERMAVEANSLGFNALFDSLISCKNIQKDLASFMNNTDFNEISFINNLYKSFYRLFKISTYSKINSSFSLKEVLGYEPPINVANTLQQQARSISLNTYLEIFMKLNLCEYDLKVKCKGEQESYFLYSILSIGEIIAKNRKY